MKKIEVELIRKLLRSGADNKAGRVVSKLEPADIADLFGALSPGETLALIDVLFRRRLAARTLAELPEELMRSVLESIEERKLSSLVSRLPPDDGAMLIEVLPPSRQAAVLDQLGEEVRRDIEQVLLYPEESAGRLMNPRAIALPAETTAEETIQVLRREGPAAETAWQVFVVDEARHLVGVVPLPRLVVATPETPLRLLSLPDALSVMADADQEQVAQLVARYDLVAVPVVDDQHRLVGVITVDDIIDVIQEEATEDIYRMAGLDEGDRVFSSMGASVRRRLPWNFLNMLTSLFAANVVGMFEATISQMVALATFMPVIAGMGGNTGNQALTVVTRSIALGEIGFSSGLRAVAKEFGVGSSIGLLMGSVVAGLGWLWKGDAMLGLVIFLAMLCNLALAGLLGAAIPLLLDLAGQDPALGGGIVLTAVTDSVGFFTFLGLASLLLL